MKRGRSTGKPTRAESAWIEAIKAAGCVCCVEAGFPHDPEGSVVEAHHLLSGGIRRGHAHSIGLCAWHHRNRLIVECWSARQHRDVLGPSLADGSVPFHERFGSDDELMAKQVAMLAGEAP